MTESTTLDHILSSRNTEADAIPSRLRISASIAEPMAVRLKIDEQGFELPAREAREILAAFASGTAKGLLALAGNHTSLELPPPLHWCRSFGEKFIDAARASPFTDGALENMPSAPDAQTLARFAEMAPPMQGSARVSPSGLSELWIAMGKELFAQLSAEKTTFDQWLAALTPSQCRIGRVYFNLSQSPAGAAHPFTFSATYTAAAASGGGARHAPLAEALHHMTWNGTREQLLAILSPIQKATAKLPWVKNLYDTNSIFKTVGWTSGQAMRLLQDAPALEKFGILLRTPSEWKSGRPSTPMIKANIGSCAPSKLGLGALLDFDASLALDGEKLTDDELLEMAQAPDGLQKIRNQWVVVDKERLARLRSRVQAMEEQTREGVSIGEAMRLSAGLKTDLARRRRMD